MPPQTAVPSDCRLPAPAPVANTSGSTPRMNAKLVMMIGRNRIRAASSAACTTDRPPSRSSRANSTMRIAFLLASAMMSTTPI